MSTRTPTDSPCSADAVATVKKAPPRRKSPSRVKAKEASIAALSAPRVEISAELRHSMIEEAAYLRAERRGFTPGHDQEDWFAAEADVDALLRETQSATAQ